MCIRDRFTSGSTGIPKGVLIDQRAIVRLVRDTNYIRIAGDDRIAMAASPAFDACTFEVWGALLNGARAVVLDAASLGEAGRFAAALQETGASVLFLTTSLFNQFSEASAAMFGGLRVLLTGGENASPDHFDRVREACPHLELVHVYGPTENTTFSTYHPVRTHGERAVPIGGPVANTSVYVLDQALRLVPFDVPGEICTGGDGVARGYLDDEALTARRFAPDPFREGRLYRTGDIGRRRADGAIVFVGRADGQVKVRGFRIEPGEIEAAIHRHDAVVETIVVPLKTSVGTLELAAYYTSRSPLEAAELRAHLAQSLPAHMVPAHVVLLDVMPLSATGKIDRRALPAPGERARDDRGAAPARDERERILVRIWQELLARDVGIDDDYFELGGDSIKSIQMSSRLRQAGWKLEMRDLFEHARIAALAPKLTPIGAPREEEAVARGPIPLTPIQRWFFEQHDGRLDHFNMSVDLRAAGRVDEERLRAALQVVWDRHDALRLRFRNEQGAIVQELPEAAGPVAFQVCDETEAARMQGTLRLNEGPLFQAALVRGTGDRVVLVCHHLIVDAVSLRIIIEDLEHAYAGRPLPPKTDSFARWSRALVRFAQSDACAAEAAYWSTPADAGTGAPIDLRAGRNRYADARSTEIVLSDSETARLNAAKPARSGVASLLLTALVRATCGPHAGARMEIIVEGHGRESIEEGVNVDRTVGWLTSLFPLRVDLHGATLREQVQGVADRLRAVPRNGLSYGVARYVAPDAVAAPLRTDLPAIAFNYLGEFNDGAGASFFALAGEAPGSPIDGGLERANVLDVVAVVMGGCLRVSFVASEDSFADGAIDRLAAGVHAELLAMADRAEGRPRDAADSEAFPGVSADDLTAVASLFQ